MDALSIIHVALGAAIVLSIGARVAVWEDHLPRGWSRTRRLVAVTLDVMLVTLPLTALFGLVAGALAFASFVPVVATIIATLTVERRSAPASRGCRSGVVVPFRRRASDELRDDPRLSPR